MLQKRLILRRWQSLIEPWENVDWLLFILPVGLTLLGGILIRSTELNYGWTDWWQHWLFGGIGFILSLAIARCRYHRLLQLQWLIYALTNASLIAVIFIGTTALGAQRWITIGGFNIQPSEFGKVGALITLAALLQERTAATIPAVIKALAIISVPWILVFIQPDLGTSLVFGALTLGMLYWGNANPGWLLLMISPIVSAILFGVCVPDWSQWPPNLAQALWRSLPWLLWVLGMGAIGFFTLPWRRLAGSAAFLINILAGELGHILWGLLKDYQKDRLILFLNPEKDPLGGGYHLIQSRIAIGAGQLWGRGLFQGTQTQLNFIPEQHTDFIFSAIGEELGFVGCVLVMFVFWIICLRLVALAQNAPDNFGSLLTIGVLSMLLFQVVVNIGMTIGLAPVTGIPLPWLSYGRSAILTNFIAIGIVQAVANTRQQRRNY